jgi:hypothetical protein
MHILGAVYRDNYKFKTIKVERNNIAKLMSNTAINIHFIDRSNHINK